MVIPACIVLISPALNVNNTIQKDYAKHIKIGETMREELAKEFSDMYLPPKDRLTNEILKDSLMDSLSINHSPKIISDKEKFNNWIEKNRNQFDAISYMTNIENNSINTTKFFSLFIAFYGPFFLWLFWKAKNSFKKRKFIPEIE